jgi:CRP/FNR family transcriptional regulator
MHCAIDINEKAPDKAEEPTPPRAPRRLVRRLAQGDILYQKGDTRSALYRVESGALCHYILYEDGRHEVIEFAFPGDIVGLGHLEAHISTSQAVVATEVSQVSALDLDREIAADSQLALRLAAAADREFEVLRARALAARERTPAHKLAALLAALSHINGSEGRDPALIGDDLSPGTVAARLDLSVDDVTHALVELQRQGLIAATSKGLRLENIGGLEKLADAA